MKKKLYSLFLTALLGLTGTTAWAQTPEPTAKWTFDNTEDLMAPSVGSLSITPCLIPGNFTISPTTLGDAEIVSADGPTEGSKAIYVPKKAALKIPRAEGAEASTTYTIMMDVMVPDANPFNGLLQMDENNDHDGDLFINKYKVGIGSYGYAGTIKDNTWYRVVFTYDEGSPEGTQAKIYLNGNRIIQGGTNTRYVMAPSGFYVLCDEDGEKVEYSYLAEVAYWETPLTDEEVSELGAPIPPTVMAIATPDDLLNFAEAINSGEELNAYLANDIDMGGTAWTTPIGISSNMFVGKFDGQGHSITGFNTTCESDGSGLFGYTSGAVIKDFSIYGKLEATAGTGSGVVGYPSNSTISGIHSYLEISVPVGEVHHVGGVVGSARGGNNITGCTFHGSMQVAAGSTDNFAGIVAYLGGDNVSFCANYGTITFDETNCAAGGIAGYCNNTSSWVHNCLNMGKLTFTGEEGTSQRDGAFVGWLRNHDPEKMTGNCWLEGSASSAGRDGAVLKLETAFCFNEAQYASGEVCYMLNGDQSVIGWYQTLPGDDAPVLLDPTHAQVYRNGRIHCNGDAYTDTDFSNENIGITQDDHNPVDGFCGYCGLFFADGMTPNADGYYEIANAKQLAWFEQKVNTGELTANAILTADIDFADLMPEGAVPEETEINWTPIGDWGNTRGVGSASYQGHFDGQGHTIKNLNTISRQNFFGLFGVISSNCLIENFDIYGTYKSTTQYCGGIAAYARDINPTIRNVHSFVNINNTSAGGRQGGILGAAMVDNASYKTLIENCTYSGILDGNDAGGGGNYGGIVGYVNNNKANVVDIVNCLFAPEGQVVNLNEAPGGCTFGGIVGYNNGGSATIKNCLSLGTVSAAEKKFGQFFGALNGNNSVFVNCYYAGDFVNGEGSGGKASGEEPAEADNGQLESGEICWKLNEESFIDVAWHQVLGEQEYPVPYGEDGIVYQTNNDDYKCISNDPQSVSDFISDVIANETEFIENTVAYQTLLDEYETEVNSWKDIETLEEFLETYKAAMPLKDSIKTSAANYAAYVQACEAAAAYIEENNLEGNWTELLKTYLEQNIEPNNNYPNGSYAYIMYELGLNDDALAEEIAFVDQMLQNAIAGGVTAGTEITRLFTNTNFADAFEGWTVENEEGVTMTDGGVPEVMHIVRGLGKGTFSVSQTVNELPEGIYMMTTNALFSPASDNYSKFYAGQAFMNGTVNYVMAISEEILDEDDAEEGLVQFEDGYVPDNMKACSYAFNGGHYENFVATEVTDGSLTIGVRNLGTGLSGDWLPFSNVHVYYLGTASEAEENLAKVIEGYKARANVIVNFDYSSDNQDFAKYPNMSKELTAQLADAIAAADEAQDKMKLINTFSNLFNEIHACRKAYIAMYDAANKLTDYLGILSDIGMISEEEYNYWDEEIIDAQTHYDEGDVSTEKALEIAEKLNNCDLILKPVDGIYQLASARDMILFAMLVNNGMDRIDAVLTADIDLGDLVPAEDKADADPSEILEINWTPIGYWGSTSAAYRGHFDGQGHSIKNLNATSNQNFFALFGVLSDGAVIENFSIYGNINANVQYVGGAAGFSRDTETVIRNVHSFVNINNTLAGARQGGVLGTAQNGKTTIENCTYSGTLDSNDAGGSGNYGGIIGYVNNSSAAIADINNCLFDGNVINSAEVPGNCTFGGMVGYNNSGTVTIKNCLSIGTVKSARASQFFGAINGNNSTFDNNYYVGANVNGPGSGGTVAGSAPVLANDEQLKNGEICYKLNGDQTAINWFQTITVDNYPVLNPNHETVLFNEADGIFYNLINGIPVGINKIASSEPEVQAGIYNLAGQRLEKMQKGINIVNGKKVLVK